MPFFNDKPFPGQDENPLVKSVFVRTWNDDVIVPPPGSSDMITELLDLFMISEAGDQMITE